MSKDKLVSWNRIHVPEDAFTGEKTPVELTEHMEGISPSQLKDEKIGWLWPFPKKLHDYINEDPHFWVAEKKASLHRSYDLAQDDVLKEAFVLHVPDHSEVDLYFDYNSESFCRVFSTLRIYVGKNAKLSVRRIQRLEHRAYSFFETLVTAEEGSKVELVDLQLGAGLKVVATETQLLGYTTDVLMHPLYITDDNTQADLSYTSYHRAKKTTSKILGKGILKENSRKVFRGNLHFEKGSSKSVGREEEHCYYFDELAYSDTLPALMCDEDDVIGEHGASIGKFNDRQLFYMMSRGFSYRDAKILLANGIMDQVIHEHFNEKEQDLIHEEISRMIGEL